MGLPRSVHPGGSVTVRCHGEATFIWFEVYDLADQVLQIFFPNQCIVRVLDEMAISTETEFERCEGLVADHFAYRVEGDPFVDGQSEMWRIVREPFEHYRFHTDDSCLNVISANPPSFGLVQKFAVNPWSP